MWNSEEKRAHILVFPFPGPGHIIPLLDLTNLFLTRGLTVTVVLSPSQLPLLDPLLSLHSSSLIPLLLPPPPPQSPSLIHRLAAFAKLHDPIIHWFRSHPSPPLAIVSDFFFGWTTKLAADLNVPRVLFSPSGALAFSIFDSVWNNVDLLEESGNSAGEVVFPEIPYSPVYPRWQVTHLSSQFVRGDTDWELFRNGMGDNMASWGVVFNSFTELERVYIDHMKQRAGHNRIWAVGPLVPNTDETSRGGPSVLAANNVMTWLNGKPEQSVVYVCFGSRMTLTTNQMSALLAALECSGVHFILCVKAVDEGRVDEIPEGFEDRVGNRGFVVRGWVPQLAILRNPAVGVFVTHCGWNSTLEGISAGVMLLTWPLGADQFPNANLIVDQHGIAARACEGGPTAIPDSVKLGELLADSVSKTRPQSTKVRKMSEASFKAVASNGSSIKDLDMLITELGDLANKEI